MVITFNASGDKQEVILVVFSEVTRVQPAICIQSLFGFIGHIQVAHEHMTAPETNLSIAIGIRVKDLRLAAWNYLSTAEKEMQVRNKLAVQAEVTKLALNKLRF